MSDDARPQKPANAGAPAWVMTFADLMSLLLCFFVLLLSFSELDVAKYKQLAGSMKFAFGVQRDIKAKEPPKGINVIAQEFSPGRPQPTPLNVIRQITTNDLNVNLDLGKQRLRPVPTPRAEHEPDKDRTTRPQQAAQNKADRQLAQKAGLTATQEQELKRAKQLAEARLSEKLKAERQLATLQAELKKRTLVDEKSLSELIEAKQRVKRLKKLKHNANLISQALDREIKAGSVDVETEGRKIIIRVREKASFGSGRAELKSAFRPLLARVADILKRSEGKIVVAGHTDNVPIYTERFRSNWELSSARAVSVVHEMMLAAQIPADRFLIEGYADTQPVASNDTAINRARNRRVEIVLIQGEDKQAGEISGAAPAPVQKAPVRPIRPTGIRAAGSRRQAGTRADER